MFPIFFSVSSKDITFGEKVREHFPEDWVYIYSKTGEEGVHMWDEISHNELPQSRLLVIFWSKNFTTSGGCVREILQAKELVEQGILRAIVLRLDDYPITWEEKLGDEVKPTFDALRSLLDFRTSSENLSVGQAVSIVQRVAEPLLHSDHPHLFRHELLQVLRDGAKKDRYSVFATMWVSGFNGIGRETLIKEFSRSFAPNSRGFVIEIDETSLPKQTLLRIESEAFGADRARLAKLNAPDVTVEPEGVAKVIERVHAAGNYIIFRHNRIIEENVELPEWIDDVINALTASTRPKLFVISQLPISAERRSRCRENLVAQRVPTVDENQLLDYCFQLIGHFDKHPNRWTDPEIERIVAASRGTIGFLISLVRSAAKIEDFDQIDQLVARDSTTTVASITVYVRWAFSQLRGYEDEQRTLLFLNDVSPCDISDIERVISPSRPVLRVLGKLLELGLVERESENLYRLTPLFANRLSRDLIRPDLLLWLRNALASFLNAPFEVELEGHEYIRIEARIQASILSESGTVPAALLDFVSAAHWFRAGIRLYHARRREPAYRMLKKAYEKRSEFKNVSRIELIRYFCLSATMNRKYTEAEACIKLLDNVHATKSIAAFLRADLLEHQRHFSQAITEYESSIELNEGRDSRLERTYRPLIRCILYSPRPDFDAAERYAKKWLDMRRTVFGLMSLTRVYLRWKFEGKLYNRIVPKNIDKLYSDALSDLESDPGVGSAHFEMKAEEAGFTGDYSGALTYMRQAIDIDPRFELRAERWRLLAKSGKTDLANQVLDELEKAKINPDFKGNWNPFLPELARIYATALKATGKPLNLLNAFAPALLSDELGSIVASVSRK